MAPLKRRKTRSPIPVNKKRVLWMIVFSVLACSCFAPKAVAESKNKPASIFSDPGDPPPGIFFNRLEPSFYTGFAPRSQEPERIHIHLGRGNQLRITMVLSEETINTYLEDIDTRYRIYRELIDDGNIIPTQNTGFEKFEETVKQHQIGLWVKKKATPPADDYRKISLDMLSELNPGRIFHIRIDFKKEMSEWSEELYSYGSKALSTNERLNIINDMLPTRLTVTSLSDKEREKFRKVRKLNQRYVEKTSPAAWEAFFDAAKDLFDAVSSRIYPLSKDVLDFYEFTAVYPVGTLNDTARYEDEDMPLYPCPGERQLCVHQRTRTIDHIPEKTCYSYLPWIPYMHVGEKLHNSFHSLWFSIDTKKNGFIPDKWRSRATGSRTGTPYSRLWLLSRGPMSHGCTHVNAGHLLELRQILPSAETGMAGVKTYRNKSNQFDVFDIDGDGKPEVMGVRYFYAYSLKDKKPYRIRAANDRKAFYKWLYRSGYTYAADGRLVFTRVTASAFRNKKAVGGKTYKRIPLYEADYTPETLQFFKKAPIPFIRELRRISATYDADRKILGLD